MVIFPGIIPGIMVIFPGMLPGIMVIFPGIMVMGRHLAKWSFFRANTPVNCFR